MRRFLTATMVLGALLGGSAVAQSEVAPKLTLELNSLEPNDKACRATFIVRNGFADALGSFGVEMVTFDAAGLVGLMTVFDFGMLAPGKTLVKRFDLPDTSCTDMTRILVNGVARCRGESIDGAACAAALTTSNRTDMPFGM